MTEKMESFTLASYHNNNNINNGGPKEFSSLDEMGKDGPHPASDLSLFLASPGSRRCPSFKEYAEKIKQLQQENFQLRVRIYMHEQNTGVKSSVPTRGAIGSRQSHEMLGVRILDDFPEENGNITANTSFASAQSNIHCSTPNPPPSTDLLLTQIASLKRENERKSEQLNALETKLYNIENSGLKFRQENEALQEKNEKLYNQLEDLQTELGVLKMRVRSQDHDPDNLSQGDDFTYNTQMTEKSGARKKLFCDAKSDQEIEHGALIAFGGDFDRIEELESDLAEAQEKISQYEEQMQFYRNQLDEAEKEKKSADEKSGKYLRALQELGQRNVVLQKKLQDYEENFKGNSSTESTSRQTRTLFGFPESPRKSKSVKHVALQCSSSDNKFLTERISVQDKALVRLHQEHAKLVEQLQTLKSKNQEEPGSPDVARSKSNVPPMSPSRKCDSNSPDLGIDSGHDGATNSDDSVNYKDEYMTLRKAYKELASKFRMTKQNLEKTCEKLYSTKKQKEQVEKAICRQLHKTHVILKQAKHNLENPTCPPLQENLNQLTAN